MTRKEYRNAEVCTKDRKDGGEIGLYLTLDNYNIMGYYEKKTIKKQVEDLCKKYKPEKVLEIGFGLGYTATEFQKQGVKEHTIVEAHPTIFKEAKKWNEKYLNNNIILVYSFIQDFDYKDEDYDLIYDDRYELIDELKPGEIFPNWKLFNKNAIIVGGGNMKI